MQEKLKVVTLQVDDILPNRFQPRIHFNEDKISELSESIKKYGVIQPITVRQIGDKYEIIAGERRYKASLMAGLTEIPAIIQNLNDKDSSEIALIENVQREDLTPIEEAISYKKILDMGYLTQEDLATKLGVSQSTVANKLRLLQLTEEVQDALLANKISERHARSLLRLHNKNKQIDLLNKILKERLTVRRTDEEIQKILEEEKQEQQIINPGFMDIEKIQRDAQDINKSSHLQKQENPEDIEILDFLNLMDDINKNNKKEEMNMNTNDPMNQFDIPQVDIINDTSNPEPTSEGISPVPALDPMISKEIEIPEPSVITPLEPEVQPKDNPTSVNPGFMDIEKIQRDAQDITPKEKPPVDSEFLLNNPNVSVKEEKEPAPPVGKFFDVLPSMQNLEEEKEPSKIENNSIFGNNSIFTEVPSPTPSPAPVSNIESSLENVNNILENPIIEPIAPIESKEDPAKAVVPPFAPPPQMDAEGPNNLNIMPNPIENSSSIEEKIEPLIAPIMEENSQDRNMQPSIGEDISKLTITPPPMQPSSTSSGIQPLSYKTREGINAVRNVASQLRSMGIQVEMEEIDLPGIYQIVIKMVK